MPPSPRRQSGRGSVSLEHHSPRYSASSSVSTARTVIPDIRAAKITELPLIVHTRNAKVDTIAILKEEGAEECGGVMHCFTGDWEMARWALDLGFSSVEAFERETVARCRRSSSILGSVSDLHVLSLLPATAVKIAAPPT